MPINETLAQYSDFAFRSAFGVIVLALVLILFSYSAVRTNAIVQKDKAREFVGAGEAVEGAGTVRLDPPPVDPSDPAEPERRPLFERLANMGYGLTVLGFLLLAGSMLLRGFAAGRMPLGNMYEFVTMTCVVSLGVGVWTMRKQEKRPLLAFILVPIVILVFIAGTVLHTETAKVAPALQSYWLPIHVTVICLGSGIFLVSGVASMLFLYRIKYPKGQEPDTRFGRFAVKLPDAQYLDRLAYKTVVIAFPIFGAGVIMGAIWAEAAWGRFWGWDPKETVSFITWVVYAAYLHARATAGWRDTKAAWINIAGFVAMLFNLFIINMVVSGLHSYAGLN
ncbi:c-type cytochrome biogenesis protein CcsB [Tomitella biformata]|uniref:c-type cytochrome biogenesis protein CcsB n=1 Tax=Tomitella biformata TaxID=630403 RepID=UPI000465C8F0|nr:c-type cytochrome biogenesis protein CcsB [Tomitella biformata]